MVGRALRITNAASRLGGCFLGTRTILELGFDDWSMPRLRAARPLTDKPELIGLGGLDPHESSIH